MGFLDLLRPKFGKKTPPPPPPAAETKTAEPRITAPAAAVIAKAPSRTYTVKAGDTLSAIAKRELGDQSKYMLIFEANREVLKDPDKIFPGQVLKIPQESTASLH